MRDLDFIDASDTEGPNSIGVWTLQSTYISAKTVIQAVFTMTEMMQKKKLLQKNMSKLDCFDEYLNVEKQIYRKKFKEINVQKEIYKRKFKERNVQKLIYRDIV